ncbi:MAG: HupE/UreJ family protein [Acidobacteriota bacterium]
MSVAGGSRWARVLALATLLSALLIGGLPRAHAHELTISDGLLIVRGDGGVQLDLIVDLDALALGVAPNAPGDELVAAFEGMTPDERSKEIAQLARQLSRIVRLVVDGERLRPRVSFPEHPGDGTPAVPASADEEPTYLGLRARFEATLPADAEAIRVGTSKILPPVQLTWLDQRHLQGRRELLPHGDLSAPYALQADLDAASVNRGAVFGPYVRLGVLHIVPRGLDHILFVLGLFLFSARLVPLLAQVTAFTLAHTLTLGLAAMDVISLPSRPVEVLIAASIAYVGIENVLLRRRSTLGGRTAPRPLPPWRLPLVFAFGLLHGLGFAGVLGELGLPTGAELTALVGFNIGVELGQLLVLAVAAALLGRAMQHSRAHRRIVTPLSLLIAATGLSWAITRAFFGG